MPSLADARAQTSGLWHMKPVWSEPKGLPAGKRVSEAAAERLHPGVEEACRINARSDPVSGAERVRSMVTVALLVMDSGWPSC